MNELERDRLVAWLVAEFEVQNGIDVTADENAITRLRNASELAASADDKYEVNLPFLSADATGPKHLHVVLTKQRLDAIRAGLEGPPHVERGRRSAAPPPPPEPREETPTGQSESSTRLVTLVVLFIALVLAIAFTLSRGAHSHEEHEGHGQEHKR